MFAFQMYNVWRPEGWAEHGALLENVFAGVVKTSKTFRALYRLRGGCRLQNIKRGRGTSKVVFRIQGFGEDKTPVHSKTSAVRKSTLPILRRFGIFGLHNKYLGIRRYRLYLVCTRHILYTCTIQRISFDRRYRLIDCTPQHPFNQPCFAVGDVEVMPLAPPLWDFDVKRIVRDRTFHLNAFEFNTTI